MLTKQEFEESDIIRNNLFTIGAIRYNYSPPYFFNMDFSSF